MFEFMFHLKLCEIYVTLKDEKTRMKKFGDIFIKIFYNYNFQI